MIRTIAIVCAALAGLTLGCRGKKPASPAECMQQCEQGCPYRPDGVGDNEDYLECLEACEQKCA
jgi:hypothetical protein